MDFVIWGNGLDLGNARGEKRGEAADVIVFK
jgi:hypothetical protein